MKNKLNYLLALMALAPSCSNKGDPCVEDIRFEGPMINWESNENYTDSMDLISLLGGKEEMVPRTTIEPANDFFQTEFSRHDKSRNFSDSLLDNVDFRDYFGPLLERFRISFVSKACIPVALEIGKSRPGKFRLIIKYYLQQNTEGSFKPRAGGLQYHFIDDVPMQDTMLCSNIMEIARNLHPIDTGQEMSCFHEIEYFCAYPNFSTYFNVNCARVEDNKEYFSLLKNSSNLISRFLEEREIKVSHLDEFIDAVKYWETTFYDSASRSNAEEIEWKFFDKKKR